MNGRHALLAGLVLLAACGAERLEVSADAFGARWPFTVERGTLVCDGPALYFEARGVRYALNAPAYLKGHGHSYQEIDRPDPAHPGGRLSARPLVDFARQRCPDVAVQ